jgi:NAD(P)-dependent dehydrogenase (short-subunit alcohol dehydrogenase family)
LSGASAHPVIPERCWQGGGLGGRQVLVIGACGALGRATALACAAQGATVVLLGRRVTALEKLYDDIELAGGPQPALYPMNLEGATPADMAELATRLQEALGRLDGVVYAAGRLHGLTPVELYEPEEWLRTLQVGLNAPFLLLQALLPLLAAAPAARVLFALDDPGLAGRAYWGAYGVGQAALRSLIAITGAEWSGHPMAVMGVQLAPMQSAFRSKAVVNAPAGVELVPPARYARLLSGLLAQAPADWNGLVLDASAPPPE